MRRQQSKANRSQSSKIVVLLEDIFNETIKLKASEKGFIPHMRGLDAQRKLVKIYPR